MAVRALREALALPSCVTGPLERAPLRREASIWAGERVAGMAVVRLGLPEDSMIWSIFL